MKIVCFGDSNTWGYDPRGFFGGRYDHPWPEMLAAKLGCSVINMGENGREIPKRAPAIPVDTDLLIVMLGTNDLLQGASADAVCRDMERFLKELDLDQILLLAPPPMKPGEWVPTRTLIEESRSLAAGFGRLSERLGIRFADAGQWNVPLGFDGVHLTQEGHSVLAQRLFDIVST